MSIKDRVGFLEDSKPMIDLSEYQIIPVLKPWDGKEGYVSVGLKIFKGLEFVDAEWVIVQEEVKDWAFSVCLYELVARLREVDGDK